MPRGIGGAIRDGEQAIVRILSAKFGRMRSLGADSSSKLSSGSADQERAHVPAKVTLETNDDIEVSESSTRALLEARKIQVRFGGVVAVNCVDLDVGYGEIVGLVGPNGSGKTSLLNAITGIVSATGVLSVAGKSIPLGKPHKTRASGIMRTFQAPQNYAELSCLENVLLSTTDRHATGIFTSWIARPWMFRHEEVRWILAEEALARVGLSDLAQSHSSELPYGKERLLELARAMAGRPKLLLLDEPSAGLTAFETLELGALLSGIRSEGVSMLIVDHKIDFLLPLCDRLIVLDLGEVIASGTPSTVLQDERVVDAYLGGSVGEA
jgi:ABC-type branched-subunit amino acid transport system ATPase component